MNQELRLKLLEMKKTDEQVRSDLVQRGVLFEGYHPEMEDIHNKNADALALIIDEYGWPTKSLVDSDGTQAAWLILQHAIGKPDFQRKCLEILGHSDVDPSSLACLEDRINVFEGKKQIYGTQFDWDQSGKLCPSPIDDPDHVDELRKNVGLPPLQDAIDQIRLRAEGENDNGPRDFAERQERFHIWAKRVGWRK